MPAPVAPKKNNHFAYVAIGLVLVVVLGVAALRMTANHSKDAVAPTAQPAANPSTEESANPENAQPEQPAQKQGSRDVLVG